MKKKLTKAQALYEGLQKDYEQFRIDAKANLRSLRYPAKRALLSIDAADAQGKLNGMTVVELLTIVNLTDATNERVFLTAQGKTITVWAQRNVPPSTMEGL